MTGASTSATARTTTPRRAIAGGVGALVLGLSAATVPMAVTALPAWSDVLAVTNPVPQTAAVSTTVSPCYATVVDAPVVDPFRPPAQPWQPGNRGLEFATEPGQDVFAAASGRVTFAGSIGHSRYVTVAHDNGLRTSYSYLLDVAVTRGQRVHRGERIGHATARLHLGLRFGDRYLDPARLVGHRCVGTHAILVPLDGGTFATPAD